jgi:phosphodiesterase/alkaline phosphatase D-like protein
MQSVYLPSGTEANLYGLVNPKLLVTTVIFEYGLTTGYGLTVTATESPLAVNDLEYSVTAYISGLEPGKTYHVRIKAVNSVGTTYSPDYTFISLGEKPTATMQSVYLPSGTEANLYGLVNPKWAGTTITFEYGLTTSYGLTVTATESPLTANDLEYSVTAYISGLEPGKTYHVRIKAVNSVGTTYSADFTFVTP